MSGIETMAIDVPDGLLSKVRELAGADGHGSEQDAIRVALVAHFGFPDTVEEIDDDFLDREVLPILDAIERGEEELIPVEQVFAEIRAEMAQRALHCTAGRASADVVGSLRLARGASPMARTERITVEIPAEIGARLRDAVAVGAFGSESEAVQMALEAFLVAPPDSPLIDDDWLRREVLPVLERIDRGEEGVVSLEEAFDGVEERYLARKANGRGEK